MNVLFVLIPTSLVLVTGFVAACLWAIHKGQYRDMESPRWRLLFDETSPFDETHLFDETKVQGNNYGKD